MIQHHVLIKRDGLHDLLFSFSTNCHGGGAMAGYSASYDKIEDTIVKFEVDSTMGKTNKAKQSYQSSSEEQDTAIPSVESSSNFWSKHVHIQGMPM